jgi:hypothetical protein
MSARWRVIASATRQPASSAKRRTVSREVAVCTRTSMGNGPVFVRLDRTGGPGYRLPQNRPAGHGIATAIALYMPSRSSAFGAR